MARPRLDHPVLQLGFPVGMPQLEMHGTPMLLPRPPLRRLSAQGAAQLGAPQVEAHECLIELLTGRTHQIRAQLSAVGCPLLGDSLYAPLAFRELRQASSPSPQGRSCRSSVGTPRDGLQSCMPGALLHCSDARRTRDLGRRAGTSMAARVFGVTTAPLPAACCPPVGALCWNPGRPG